jgi:hypothetical protein
MATNTKFLLFLTKLQDAVPDNEDDLIKSIMEEVDLSIAKFPVKWNGKKHRSRTCGKTGYNIFMRQMESSDVPRDERMGVVARLWKGLSDEQKSKYNKIAEKENAAAGIVKKVKKGESDKKAKSDSDSDSDKKDKKAEKDKKANESEKKSEKKESEKDKKERIKELEKQRKKEVEELQKQKELLEKKKKELEQKKKDEALKKKAKYESSDDDFSENDSTSEDESEDEIENSDVEDSDAETASEDEDDE